MAQDSFATVHEPNRRRRILILLSGIALIVVVFVSVASWRLVRWWNAPAQEVAQELARLRRNGDPISPQELEEYYRLPDDVPDVTQLWLDAAFALHESANQDNARFLPIVGHESTDEPIPPPGSPWTDLQAVQQFLAENKIAMKTLHAAAKAQGAARYPTKFDESVNMSLVGVEEIRSAARVLCLEAYSRAHQGDAEGAAESLIALFRLSGSLDNYPIIVAQLVRTSIFQQGCHVLETILPHSPFPTEHLQKLRRELERHDFDGGLHAALLGERVIDLQVFDDPTLAMDGSNEKTATAARNFGKNWRHADRAFFLRQMSILVEGSKRPWPEKFDAPGQFDEANEAKLQGKINALQYTLSLLLLPAVETVFKLVARAVAMRNTTTTGLAIEEYRRQTGQLPEDLGKLVPQYLSTTPLDPFDGKPLRYTITNKGYFVYSIGEDHRDNGGEEQFTGSPDIVFSVELAE